VRIKIPEPESYIHLDFVPMVDTLFNLLIFFLLATTIKQAEREMQIALPHASSAVPISLSLREFIVNVDAEGKMFVTGRPVDEQTLRELLAEALTINPQQKVTVRGDRNTAYANIVRVLDICKGSGIQEPYLDTVLSE
jgi:biopolymer transport protein ExbD